VIDGTGLSPGTFSLKPRINQLPEQLKVQNIVPDTIQVVAVGAVLVPTSTPTITATVAITLTTTLTSTATPVR
jgi:hypothetical protein